MLRMHRRHHAVDAGQVLPRYFDCKSGGSKNPRYFSRLPFPRFDEQTAARNHQVRAPLWQWCGKRPSRPVRHRAPVSARTGQPPASAPRWPRPRCRADWTPANRTARPAARCQSACRQSPEMSRARAATPKASALAWATASASSEISRPTPLALGYSRSKVSSRQPEPRPRSRMRHGRCRSGIKASAASIRVSLSGRGTSTAGDTLNGRPQNSRSPRM